MRRLLVAALLALAAAPAAHAGGTPVSVAATAGRVWAVDANSVVELDASTGRVLHRVRTRYGFATEVALSDGNVWVSSVDNGYTAGAVARVPFESSRGSDPLVLPQRPVFSLAVGDRATWALVGPWPHARLARIDLATRRVRYLPSHGASWLAGDGSVVVATTAHALLRIADDGSATTLAAVTAAAPPAVDGGIAWVPEQKQLDRFDVRTGRLLGSVRLPGLADSVAIGGGFAWTLVLDGNRPASSRSTSPGCASSRRVPSRRRYASSRSETAASISQTGACESGGSTRARSSAVCSRGCPSS